MTLQKKFLIGLLVGFGTIGLASNISAQTWQKVTSTGGGGEISCSFTLTSGSFEKIAPTTTTLQYIIKGGGGGGAGSGDGGNGGTTHIVIDGTSSVSAAGGSGGTSRNDNATDGSTVSGSITVNAGQLLGLFSGGGGGGGGDNFSPAGDGRTWPNGHDPTDPGNGSGGGGDYGGGGGAGATNFSAGHGGISGGNGLDAAGTSEGGLGSATTSISLLGARGHNYGDDTGDGGNAGGVSITYSANGCWI